MSKAEWDQFFDLLDKVVNQDGLSYKEKDAILVAEAEKRGEHAANNLEEVRSW